MVWFVRSKTNGKIDYKNEQRGRGKLGKRGSNVIGDRVECGEFQDKDGCEEEEESIV